MTTGLSVDIGLVGDCCFCGSCTSGLAVWMASLVADAVLFVGAEVGIEVFEDEESSCLEQAEINPSAREIMSKVLPVDDIFMAHLRKLLIQIGKE